MVQLQEHQQLTQNSKIANKIHKCPIYAEGQLVYLHKPNTTGMTANSRKFKTLWVGPFVVHEILDRTHYILADLKGNIVPDIFNFARLKPAFVRATGTKNVQHLKQLQDVIQKSEQAQDEKAVHSAYEFIDEKGCEHRSTTFTGDIYTCQSTLCDLNVHHSLAEANHGMLAPSALSTEQQDELSTLTWQSPSEHDFTTLVRARFKHGSLQLLMSVPFRQKQFCYWWSPMSDTKGHQVVQMILQSKDIRCTGCPNPMGKFKDKVYRGF
jgi:hypothetical protein